MALGRDGGSWKRGWLLRKRVVLEKRGYIDEDDAC